jgi:polar amino acid transport system permease protein
VRAGILGVEKGQWEAAKAGGLRPLQVMRLVVLPQALSKMTPPMASQFISLVKDSSIVSIVSIPDMTFMANEVAVSSGRVFETWLTASIAYFLLCFVLSTMFRRIEARSATKLR